MLDSLGMAVRLAAAAQQQQQLAVQLYYQQCLSREKEWGLWLMAEDFGRVLSQ